MRDHLQVPEQMRVTVALGDTPPGLEIHDEAGDLWGWEANPSFHVVTDDRDRAGAALLTALPRLSATTFGGFELPPDVPFFDGREENETPSYVWGPTARARGWVLGADTQGNMTVKMREHWVRVLVEELERAGVTARIEPMPVPGE